MPYRERVTHLVAVWLENLIVGKAIRRIQGGLEYRTLGSEGKEKECYNLVVSQILVHAVSTRVGRRRAQDLWKKTRCLPGS